MSRAVRLMIVVVMAAGAAVQMGNVAQAADPLDASIPYQYLAKTYSEALGRTPTSAEWTTGVQHFEQNGCTVESMAAYGLAALTSAEYTAHGYSDEAKVLTAYRLVLNREPDPAGFALSLRDLQAGADFSEVVSGLYASPEFQTVRAQACNPADPDYDFGMSPAIDIPVDGAGFVGDAVALQAELDMAEPGTTVYLAPRTVIRLLGPLYIPAGVELATTGLPDPTRYAEMGRIVRAPVWPTFRSSMVVLRGGGRLNSVWVDGQSGTPARHDAPAFNIRTESGTGTTVTRSRLGNSVGATSISSLGEHGFDDCIDNEFTYNFIEDYSSDHFGGTWSDGISIGCEDALVAYNQVVDTTDVSIITFSQPFRVQISEVRDNIVLNAGQGAFAPLGISGWINPKGVGDGPFQASMDFTGSVFKDNVFWNSPRSVNEAGILVGVRMASAHLSYNGFGQVVTNNGTGDQRMWAQNGIIVSGMLDTTVIENDINLVMVDNASTCPPAAVGAYVTGGHASGNIQGPYLDAVYSGCIAGPTGLY